jgi:transposase
MGRRRYSDEYKREAVALTEEPGVTQAQVARDLGISANMLGKWVREVRELGARAFPGKGKARDEELAALKRELARVKKERDFLRDAATFFAKHPR